MSNTDVAWDVVGQTPMNKRDDVADALPNWKTVQLAKHR